MLALADSQIPSTYLGNFTAPVLIALSITDFLQFRVL